MRLEDKRVLITGTAGGQGEAAQAMFAREGARIIGCDVQEGAAEKTADALRADGHDVTGFTVDLADAEAAARWVDESAERTCAPPATARSSTRRRCRVCAASPRSGRPRTPRPRAA
jgi:NAD(P)-dependent dehydrogenase (short-subunit alcohol dehydrogenase family)